MKQHLSSQQILEWMNGEYAPEVRAHVRECGACAARVEGLSESLAMFRGAVRETAETMAERQTVLRMPRRRLALRWATAAAALVILAGLPVYKVQKDRVQAAEIARQDAELLEQVDAELSSGVATPMKPLEKMVSWGSSGGKNTELRKF